MDHTNLPGIPLINSTAHNDLGRRFFSKQDRSKPTSSPYMTTPVDQLNKRRKNTEAQKSLYEDEMMRELAQEYSNVSNYKVVHNEEVQKQDYRKTKKTSHNVSGLQHHQSTPIETQTIYPNLNRYTLNERNTYGEEGYYRQQQHPRYTQSEPQDPYTEPEPFRYIKQTDTQEDEQQQQEIETFAKTKSAKNLKALNEIMMVKKNSGFIQKEKRRGNERVYQMDELEKNAILQNFRVSDLHFLNDQQFLPQNMVIQRLNQKKSAKLSANHSGKSESNHAVFRDTIQYVDSGGKYDMHQNYTQYNQQSHISEHSSMSSSPLTNAGQGYRGKYRRYKEKYMNMVEVVRQFEMLNETLIKDQREHFRYYEDTIRHLENLLLMKDKEIEELNHLVGLSRVSRVSDERNGRELCSIEGRQLDIENQKLKKQVETKQQQIQSLKQNIKSLDESCQLTQKSKQTPNRSLQKKNELLKKQKESLLKRIKPLQELIKTYQQKMKDKEERVNKLSEMNSQLQEEILKLKSKIRLEETYDTERDYRISFAPKIKDQFVQPADSLLQNKTSLENSLNDPRPNPQIEKYLACIDNQLQLIRSHMTSKFPKNDTNDDQSKKKQVSHVLNFVDELEGEESHKREPQQNPSLNELISVVDRLASFRVSMGG